MRTLYVRLVFWLRTALTGWRPGWRDWMRAGALPAISGGAGETKTTLANVLKEYYGPGGIVNSVNVDTWLLDKLERAKTFKDVGGR